ncbi:MAG TPA: DUF3106 domain-containing protein, partial [Planctomycetota bacterium]|nr:DUF3106 domain-containing protein [Planctomycetota bacterium]
MARPRAPFRRLALARALLAFVASALPARAEDVAPLQAAAVQGAAERLTPEEVAVLRRRLPEWDRWDAAARDRVAAGVVRLRGLTPEQRARVFERGRRLDRAGPVAAETFAKNLSAWSRFGPDDRQRVLQADVTARALATEVFAGMPASVRDPAFAAPGAPGGWGPGMRASLGLAISRAWRERALASLVASPSLDHEPAASAPPARAQALRDLREKVRAAGGERAPEDLRRRYAHWVLEDRVAAATASNAAAS